MKTKRILSILLSAVLILSALTLVSCDEQATAIESINGMSAREVCDEGFEKLKETERYEVKVDAELGINVLVATVPIGIDDFYVNTTDGDNMHYKFTEEDLMFIDNATLLSLFSGYDREVWYVDGVRYSIDPDGNKNIDDSGRKPSNVVDKIIDAITDEDTKYDACYEQNGEQYVLLTMSLEDFGAENVACKVFVTPSGDITRAEVDGELYGFKISLTLNFNYGDIAPIEVPEGF